MSDVLRCVYILCVNEKLQNSGAVLRLIILPSVTVCGTDTS